MEIQPDPSPSAPADAHLRRNVELKARLPALDECRSIAHRLATSYLGVEHQIDTYFDCRHGRLKLREIDGRNAQLIWYDRSDRAEARLSQYYLETVPHPHQLKVILESACGIRRIVEKHREIFLVDNVRIHLDDVRNLGCFLEFEAVMEPETDLAVGHEQLARLSRQFGISPAQVLSGSYGEMA